MDVMSPGQSVSLDALNEEQSKELLAAVAKAGG
jgi:hypothetical protein